MEFKDYYQTLNIARDADPDAIKRSYRRLARRYHPDVSDDPDAEARFKEVQEAYSVLKDPEKRKAYDRFGAHWKEGQDFRPPPDWSADWTPERGTDPDFGDRGGFADPGEFSDFFENLFGGAGRRRYQEDRHLRMKGQDLHAKVRIPVEDAYAGTTRSLSLQVPEVDDSGHVVTRVRTLNVKIPAGVSQGQRIRLAGQGGPGIGGAPAGDLYLEVVLEPHRLYEIDGRDVYLDLPVAPWEAALGDTVAVPTLGGRVGLKIPPGSRSGARLRLKGRGLPGDPPGDQFVVLEMVTPSAETEASRALYARMKREMPFDPRADLGE